LADSLFSQTSNQSAQTGTLYVVATPIGNLDDMTFRAVKILQTVDRIAAEDTRHTGRLLQHFQVKTPQISYHEHNHQQRVGEMVAKLQQGESIALVTDAGMPGISDPGYELIVACVEVQIPVVPIPGCSAVVTALSAAGLPTDRFVFEGFLPVKGQERATRLGELAGETRTIVIYESPHRLRQTLQDLAETLGAERSVVLARELTKLHEEFWRGNLATAQEVYTSREPKGEYTLVINGFQPPEVSLSPAVIRDELKDLLSKGMSRSQASRHLAKLTSLPRKQIYQMALEIDLEVDLEVDLKINLESE
jgi:16S rRNA (cytidine1402-2'-O)-methyltransferase